MFWMKNRQLYADLGAIKWFWANVFFCDLAQSDNHPQDYLAKFGNIQNMKVKKLVLG